MEHVRFLDGLRGLACLQVVLLHIINSYFPTFIEDSGPQDGVGFRVHHSPVFFLYHGHFAVLLFFILSGYVLTRSFLRSGSIAAVDIISGRLARLYIPTTFFMLFNLVLWVCFHHAHRTVGEFFNCKWLAYAWNIDLSSTGLFREIFLNPVLFGYTSGMGGWIPWVRDYLTSSGASINGPVWSLSIEFLGSILTLGLVRIYARQPFLWIIACFAGIYVLPGEMLCFVIGNVACILQVGEKRLVRASPFAVTFAMLLLAIAIFISTTQEFNYPRNIFSATLIFFVVSQCMFLRRLLEVRIVDRIGVLSFTIYLCHWGIVIGLGPWLSFIFEPLIDVAKSRYVIAPLLLLIIFIVSDNLLFVDRYAIKFANRVKNQSKSQAAAGVYRS